jgi:flagellar motor switch/type III secretory pathway protein FliN
MLKPSMHEDKQDFIDLENYASIMDVDVAIFAELDQRIVSFGELVSLDIDSLLPLHRPSGENIDLYIGDVLLGNGEILVVEGKLAVRVADLRDKPSTLHTSTSPVESE